MRNKTAVAPNSYRALPERLVTATLADTLGIGVSFSILALPAVVPVAEVGTACAGFSDCAAKSLALLWLWCPVPTPARVVAATLADAVGIGVSFSISALPAPTLVAEVGTACAGFFDCAAKPLTLL